MTSSSSSSSSTGPEQPSSISPSNNDTNRQQPNPSVGSDADGNSQTENRSNDCFKPAKDADTRQAQATRGSTGRVLYDSSPFPDHITGDLRHGQLRSRSRSPEGSSTPPSPTSSTSWARYARRKWLMSKGMIMVLVAQFFGASMNTMTRILQLDGPHGKGMNPFEILFVRMLGTVICSVIYMWYAKVPHPFGIRSIRTLLVIRGVAGFFGVFGLYYSLLYLPLSEATVLTFLAPILSCYACSLIMPDEVFTRMQQVAGVGSLLGVIIISRPMSLFSSGAGAPPQIVSTYNNATTTTFRHSSNITSTSPADTVNGQTLSDDVDATHRLIGIAAALTGVLGATVAYTSIRKIGQRAHALVSVTYFSVLTAIISIIAVLAIPSVNFRLPSNWTELLLLFGLATCGFLLQFLLTAGLAYVPPDPPPPPPPPSTADRNGEGNSSGGEAEKQKPSTHGSRATSMVYTQMLFALFYDKVVLDTTPPPMSWAGSAIILFSAVYVAFAQDGSGKNKKTHTTKTEEGETQEEESDELERGVATVVVNEEDDHETDEDTAGAGTGEDGTRGGAAGWWKAWRWGLRRHSSRYNDETARDYERRRLLGQGHEDEDNEYHHHDR